MHCPTCLAAFETKRSNLLDENKILDEIQEIKQAVVANTHDIKKFSHCNQDIGSTCQKESPSHDLVSKRLRFKGVTESTSKEPLQRQIDEQNSVQILLHSLDLKVPVVNITSLGRYRDDRKRAINVGFNCNWDAKLVLHKAIAFKLYNTSAVFVRKDLTTDEQNLQKQALKQRYELIKSGVDKSMLKIFNYRLQRDGTVISNF